MNVAVRRAALEAAWLTRYPSQTLVRYIAACRTPGHERSWVWISARLVEILTERASSDAERAMIPAVVPAGNTLRLWYGGTL